MYRLLYISTARTAFCDDTLERLLADSRRNNATLDVTGLLIVGGKRFMQALEGPEPAVAATYERIRRDPRHFAIVELNRGPIDARTFGRWAMGFERGGSGLFRRDEPATVASLIEPIADPIIKAYFAGFATTSLAA